MLCLYERIRVYIYNILGIIFKNNNIVWVVKRQNNNANVMLWGSTCVINICCSSKKHGWGRPLPGRRIRQLGESGSGLDLHIWRNIRFVQWQDHQLSSVITSKMSTPAMWCQLSVCTCYKILRLSWCNKQALVTSLSYTCSVVCL